MIVVGGENLIDLVSEKQTDNEQPHYLAIPGGGPFNVAMAVGRQGCDVTYVTPISSDAFGDLLATRLFESNVAVAAPRVQQPTSLSIVSLTADGVASYSFHRNGTAERQVTLDILATYVPAEKNIFHVGGLALIEGDDAEAWKVEFQRCKDAGILTSFDPNVRPALIHDRNQYVARLQELMNIADVVKLSDEDLEWLYPDRPLEQAVTDCRTDCNAALFILTLGAAGARGFVEAGDVHMPSATINIMVDTVGAGDTFMATILRWIIETGRITSETLSKTDIAALTTALSVAAKAAALNCEESGCNPPWRHQLDEAMLS